MKGYKGFNKDLVCRGFQYEVEKTYEIKEDIKICEKGFHFCKEIIDVISYYNIEDEDIRLCEIEALGKVIEEDNKCVTNKIKIIKEINKEEMYELTNEGRNNKGLGNTGNWNTGNRNTGNRNTGDSNTGYWNTGDWNTGYSNTGYSNTGYSNTGYWNTGNRNTGDSNTGYWNTGDWNTGYSNTGYSNTGNRNTGDWNKTNRSAGVLCNVENKLRMFNKETDITWKEWQNSRACYILNKNIKSKWIPYNDMSKKEKLENENAKICGGYLKEIERKVSSKKWWNSLETCEKLTILQLPNFDLDVFNDIMELKITKKEYKELLEEE